MAVAIALMSSILGGSADFFGGRASRRSRVLTVVAFSQLVGLALLLVIIGFVQPAGLDVTSMLWAAAAGVAVLIGLVAFYAALAEGTMGAVAPIAALGAVVPLAWGLTRGESLSIIQFGGIVIAMVGVFLAGAPELNGVSEAGARPIFMAFVAAIGFGSSLMCLSEAADGGILMTLVIMKCVVIVSIFAVVFRKFDAFLNGVHPGDCREVLLIALADLGAIICLTYALTIGMVSVVSVLGSMYPVATVFLARWLLEERITVGQKFGVGAVLTGVVFISAGT